eukprot:3900775-Amphidinium_carterae.1
MSGWVMAADGMLWQKEPETSAVFKIAEFDAVAQPQAHSLLRWFMHNIIEYGLKCSNDIIHVDALRALMHAPEARSVFVERCLEAYSDVQDYMCRHKIDGRRDGPRKDA